MLAEIGAEGQMRLRQSSVLIVGLGGLGAPVATYLTGAGVGHIGMVDVDTVSESNLQRQVLYTEAEIGRSKLEMAARRLASQSASTRFTTHCCRLTALNAADLISGYDLVVDCTDNYATRFVIDDACARLGKPWVHGAIGEFIGQVTVFTPGGGKRYTDLYTDREALTAAQPGVHGVLGAVPGVIGALQASEAIKLICRFGEPLVGRLFTINMKTMITNTFEY